MINIEDLIRSIQVSDFVKIPDKNKVIIIQLLREIEKKHGSSVAETILYNLMED